MFCPRCATQNELEQGYCRRCGQSLSSVRLALEGSTDKSLESLRAGEERIKGGSTVLVIFTLIALANAFLGIALNQLFFGYIAFINLLLGTIIATPLVCSGRTKIKRAVRLLSKSQNEIEQSIPETQQQHTLPAAAFDTQSPLPTPQGSVTEHTTLDLRRSGQARPS